MAHARQVAVGPDLLAGATQRLVRLWREAPAEPPRATSTGGGRGRLTDACASGEVRPPPEARPAAPWRAPAKGWSACGGRVPPSRRSWRARLLPSRATAQAVAVLVNGPPARTAGGLKRVPGASPGPYRPPVRSPRRRARRPGFGGADRPAAAAGADRDAPGALLPATAVPGAPEVGRGGECRFSTSKRPLPQPGHLTALAGTAWPQSRQRFDGAESMVVPIRVRLA